MKNINNFHDLKNKFIKLNVGLAFECGVFFKQNSILFIVDVVRDETFFHISDTYKIIAVTNDFFITYRFIDDYALQHNWFTVIE